MPNAAPSRADYVVQLDVEAIAVVTVQAVSVEAAVALAERDLRAVDVTEVRSAEAAIVSGPHPPSRARGVGILRRGRQEPQETAAHGRQA